MMSETVTQVHLTQAAVHYLPDGRSMGLYWVRDDGARFILKGGSPDWQGTLDVGATPVLRDGQVITFVGAQIAGSGRPIAVFTIQPELAARLGGVL